MISVMTVQKLDLDMSVALWKRRDVQRVNLSRTKKAGRKGAGYIEAS